MRDHETSTCMTSFGAIGNSALESYQLYVIDVLVHVSGGTPGPRYYNVDISLIFIKVY